MYPFSQLSQSTRYAGKVVTMSGGLDVLQMKEEDVLKFLAAGTHLGGTNLDFQMDQYVYKRKSDGELRNSAADVGRVSNCPEVSQCLRFLPLRRYLHHQLEEDLGEAAAGRQGHRRHREPS